MREFVERIGGVFQHEGGDLMRTAEVVEQVAAGLLSERDLIAWMADRIT
jgi:hypothetical protein